MTDTGQDFATRVGQDQNIVVTLADLTITGWSLAAYFRNRQTGTLATTKVTPTEIVIDSATQCTIKLTDADTDTWTPGRYDWSLWRTDNGSESPLSIGTITVTATSRGLAPV